MGFSYYFDGDLDLQALLLPIARTEDRLARLDERLRSFDLTEGVTRRALLYEAVAHTRSEGKAVDLRDLALLDAESLHRIADKELTDTHDVLKQWRKAAEEPPSRRLLSPGSGADYASEVRQNRPTALWDPDYNEAGRLSAWRAAFRETETLPPTLAGAVAMDAWLMLQPEQRGDWQGALLAALTLKARGKTQWLLPISWGARPEPDLGSAPKQKVAPKPVYRWDERTALNKRLIGILSWMEAAADKMNAEANKLAAAHKIIRGELEKAKRRKNSRLPQFAELLLTKGPLPIQAAADALGVKHEAVRQFLTKKQLGNSPRELTGGTTYQLWDVVSAH